MILKRFYTSKEFCEKNDIKEEDFYLNIGSVLEYYNIDKKSVKCDEYNEWESEYFYKIPCLAEPIVALMVKTYGFNPLGYGKKRPRKDKEVDISIDKFIEYNKKLIKEIDKLPYYLRYEIKKSIFYTFNYRISYIIPVIIEKLSAILSKIIVDTNVDAGNMYTYLIEVLQSWIINYEEDTKQLEGIKIDENKRIYSIEKGIEDICKQYIEYNSGFWQNRDKVEYKDENDMIEDIYHYRLNELNKNAKESLNNFILLHNELNKKHLKYLEISASSEDNIIELCICHNIYNVYEKLVNSYYETNYNKENYRLILLEEIDMEFENLKNIPKEIAEMIKKELINFFINKNGIIFIIDKNKLLSEEVINIFITISKNMILKLNNTLDGIRLYNFFYNEYDKTLNKKRKIYKYIKENEDHIKIKEYLSIAASQIYTNLIL